MMPISADPIAWIIALVLLTGLLAGYLIGLYERTLPEPRQHQPPQKPMAVYSPSHKPFNKTRRKKKSSLCLKPL